jgi:hypothetical protein
MTGALKVFPEAAQNGPLFLRVVARAWGRLAAHSPVSGDLPRECHSREMGATCAEILNNHYRVGLAGELSESRLKTSLHLRDIPSILKAKGWLLGIIEAMFRQSDPNREERAKILEKNRASLVSYALNRGDVPYVLQATEAVIGPIGFLEELAAAIAEIEKDNREMAQRLRSRKNLVISKLLHSGELRVRKEVLQGLKGWEKD